MLVHRVVLTAVFMVVVGWTVGFALAGWYGAALGGMVAGFVFGGLMSELAE